MQPAKFGSNFEGFPSEPSSGIPAIALAGLYSCFLLYLAASATQLPERVASHFDINGLPNGWMDRRSYLVFIGAIGLVLPLFVVGIFYALRFVPSKAFNLPNREYWLAPDHRARTFSYLLRHSLWLACIMECFLIGIHFLVAQANRQAPIQLLSLGIWGLAGCFLTGVALWVMSLFRHFKPVE